MDYNPLTNDGHCRDDTANKAIANTQYGKRKKQRNRARRAITAFCEYLRRIGFTVTAIDVCSKDGQIRLTEKDGYE